MKNLYTAKIDESEWRRALQAAYYLGRSDYAERIPLPKDVPAHIALAEAGDRIEFELQIHSASFRKFKAEKAAA